MVKFLLYLFESGLCLSILFPVYLFFFRKETFFRFNRFYLISIIFFSLIIPFVHFSFHVENISKFEKSITGIGKIRSYYEQLIAMTDPDFPEQRKNISNPGFDEIGYYNFSETTKTQTQLPISESNDKEIIKKTLSKKKLSIARIIFIVYIIGVIFFLTRILILFNWIRKTISNNTLENYFGNKIVHVNKNIPPFSFLKFIFINTDGLTSENRDKIITHELIHVGQLHSVDLLFAHFLTIFQWFNPLVWVLHKNIKINHEYIADNEVVSKGHNLLDYQELLINQFIPIPYVELVNNFNLISIKKRIAMMNKNKSGFIAKLKALLIIPVSILVFFLFANLTINGPGKILKNFSLFESQKNLDQLKGIWENKSENEYGYLIKFSADKLSILEDNSMIKEYQYKINDNNIIINMPGSEPVALKFQITDNKIKIWWNDKNSSEFTKTSFENSLDVYLANKGLKIKPPVVKNYNELQRASLTLFVGIQGNKIVVRDKVGKFSDLEKMISEAKSTFNQLDLNIVTVAIAVDENAPMKQVYVLNQILRKLNLLKVGFVCYPDDNPDNLHALTAFTRKLPPMDGEMEILDTKDLPGMGIEYFEIDAVNQENTPQKQEPQIKKLVSESEKYIMCLVFNNSTSYKSYTEYNDMVWNVIYGFKNRYALEKYNAKYEDLGRELQNEVREKYPIILTQVNIDEEEYNYEPDK